MGDANQMLIEESELLELSEILVFQGVLDDGDAEVLQATGIRTFKGLKMYLTENPGGINGLSQAKVDKICKEADNIVVNRLCTRLTNMTKTARNIGQKEFSLTYLKYKKRIQTLKISIALNTRGEGQRKHWERELTACEKRVANMETRN